MDGISRKINFLTKQQRLMADTIEQKMNERDELLLAGNGLAARQLDWEISRDRDYQHALFNKIQETLALAREEGNQ
ncbi:MAG: hypothetical protein ACFFD4_02455 [Candidatus Odinarchaeota archaeon]